MLLKNVRCKWASVVEPNTKFEHTWEIVALLDDAQAAVLADHGFKLKTEEDGTKSYRFKRKCQGTKKSGEKFDKQAPVVVDAAKKPFTDLIGNGSLVNIQYDVKTVPFAGNVYINGDLCGVQVLEHVPFGGAGDEFEEEGETFQIKGDTSEELDDNNPF